jgi:hypothetical protein
MYHVADSPRELGWEQPRESVRAVVISPIVQNVVGTTLCVYEPISTWRLGELPLASTASNISPTPPQYHLQRA